MPWRVGSTPFIHYNLNLLDQIGASEDDLATVDGLMGVCEKSLAAGITPIAFGNKGQWNAVHWISNFVKNFMGAERANALFSMREGSWTDADPIAGAQRMMSFVDNGYFGSSVNDDYGVPQQKYYAGETLMLGTGGWEVSGLVRKQAMTRTSAATSPSSRSSKASRAWAATGSSGVRSGQPLRPRTPRPSKLG